MRAVLIGALRERSYHSADWAQDAWAARVNQREGMGDGSGNTRSGYVGVFWTVVADERAQKLQGSYGGRYKLAILDAYLLGVYRWYCGQILFWIYKLGAGGVFHQPCMSCRELGGIFPQQEARCGRGGGETSGCIAWGRRGSSFRRFGGKSKASGVFAAAFVAILRV